MKRNHFRTIVLLLVILSAAALMGGCNNESVKVMF